MKQSLALRTGLSLTMTPALQQAIRLLQLSSLDLQQEIQQALESNVMLEMDEPDGAAPIEAGAVAETTVEKPTADEAHDEELPVELDWDGDIGYESAGSRDAADE